MNGRHFSLGLALSGWLSLLAGLAGLAGCGSSTPDDAPALEPVAVTPIPECPKLDPSACDIREAVCQAKLWEVAQCLRGISGEELPPIQLMTSEAYAAEWSMSLPDEAAPELQVYESGLAMLGLLKLGAFENDTYISQVLSWLGGVYRDETRDIVIIDRGETEVRELARHEAWRALSATLVHEFVHALQDREINLQEYSSAHSSSSDASWAAQAVVEGEARLLEMHYWAAAAGIDTRQLDWGEHFENISLQQAAARLAEPEPLQAVRRALVYSWGSRFVNQTWEERGHAGVLELFQGPPEQTHTVMSGASEALSTPVMPELLPSSEWELAGNDTLGAMGVFAAMGSSGSAAVEPELGHALEIALAWRGDALRIFSNGESTLLVWQIEFAQEASANAFLKRQRLRGEFTRKSSVLTRAGTRVILAGTTSTDPVDWGFLEAG